MASGLPVIVSQNCGCAPELVRDGVNGFTFPPDDHRALTRVMVELSRRTPAELEQMGRASREIISQWTPDFFARQLHAAALAAIDWRARRAGERLSASRRALLLALALPR
jgi:glycosyltransferase involved in cell wall biosynthesis